jgi:hypothetical protein
MNGTINDPRLDVFRRKLVKHSTIEKALGEVLSAVQQARPETVIVLTGPSGAGKSTIVGVLERHLRSIYADRMASDPGFLPYLSLRAQAPLDGHFNWKDMFTRTLWSAGEVLINRKVLPRFEMDLDGRTLDSMKGLVREELRRSLESLIRHRQVPILILDESSALLRLKRGALPFLQFEILKSLAVELRIPILLVGAYDLLGILDGTGQLLRRSQIIHLPRYRAGTEGVDPNFIDALHTLLEAIKIPMDANLADRADYFFLKSVGCIGTLKDWLDRTGQRASHSSPDKPYITIDTIEKSALSNSALLRLVKEAKAGELRLADIEDSELAKELDFGYTPSIHISAPEVVIREYKPMKKRAGRAGVRGPSRDPVGGAHV